MFRPNKIRNKYRILWVTLFIIGIMGTFSEIAYCENKKFNLEKIKFVEELSIGEATEDEKELLYDLGDIEIDDNSNIYILEVKEGRIKKFDKNGNFILSIGRRGQGPGELNYPRDFIITKDKKIFVADDENGRIDVFNIEGLFLYSFNVKGGPQEIVEDSEGNLYIFYPYKNFLVHKHKKNGELVNSLVPMSMEKDSLMQYFYNQIDLAINKDTIFVVYKFLNKIEKYDKKGNLIFSIKRPLNYEYKGFRRIEKDGIQNIFATPLTIDAVCKNDILFILTRASEDEITICDRINNRGQYKGSFIIPFPAGNINFDNENKMYLTNYEKYTVHRFEFLK